MISRNGKPFTLRIEGTMGLDIWMFIGKIGVFEAEGTGRVLDRALTETMAHCR